MTDELLRTALAGTGKSGAGSVPAGTPAERLGDGMGLLLRAGLRDAYRRAGYMPPQSPEPFAPAPETDETLCPPPVVPALTEMLEHGATLPTAPSEAFHALSRRGWVLPPVLLVPVLTSRLASPELRAVLGARGRWLAELNDAWQWALAGERQPAPEEVNRVWAEGMKSQRVALIRRLRAINALGAREMVAAGFATEPADLRQDLVRALEVGLSLAGEPFLESALDDRSRGVRQAAADLLARLPESAFVARMVARARALVTRSLLRTGVELKPVAVLPEDMRRDGIGLPVLDGLAEELGRTLRILCSIPAAVLARELGVSPRAILREADKFGAEPLIAAWAASSSESDRETLLPLLWDVWWERPLKRAPAGGTLLALTRAMPRDALRERRLRLLREPPEGTERLIVQVLEELPPPWPADVSRATLQLLQSWLARTIRKDRNAGDWPQLIRPLAEHAASGTIDESLQLLTEIERAKALPAWHPDLRQGSEALRLRRRFWDAMTVAMMEHTTTGGIK